MKALLLEQAAHCKALEAPPRPRKCGLFLVLAGLAFCNAGHLPAGTTALAQGVRSLDGKPWGLVRNELAHRLGGFYRCAGCAVAEVTLCRKSHFSSRAATRAVRCAGRAAPTAATRVQEAGALARGCALFA